MTLSRNLSTLGQAVTTAGNLPSANVSGLAAVATSGSASDLTGTIPASVGSTGDNALNAYTSPGTWTKPGTVKSIKVTVVGGGGSGASNSPLSPSFGTGGGGGGAAIRYYPAASLPGPQPYTVGGAGATSTFGVAPITVISATGGSAGVTSLAGVGGVGSNGSLNIQGSGGNATAGGSSIYGGGARENRDTPNTNGSAGGVYGGGGSGANGPAVPRSGGSGAAGVVIIEEFY